MNDEVTITVEQYRAIGELMDAGLAYMATFRELGHGRLQVRGLDDTDRQLFEVVVDDLGTMLLPHER